MKTVSKITTADKVIIGCMGISAFSAFLTVLSVVVWFSTGDRGLESLLFLGTTVLGLVAVVVIALSGWVDNETPEISSQDARQDS